MFLFVFNRFDIYFVMLFFVYIWCLIVFFFFKQKTAYEMRISDWSSDVCSSDLDGVIVAVEEGGSVPAGALDCRGELLLPGLVDLHTDHCERHAVPRPGVHWDPLQAAIAHDAQVAAAGITTVFDSLVVGLRDADQTRRDLLGRMMAAVEKGEALGLFRAQHLLHLRCEVTDPTLLDQIAPHMDHPLLQLVSGMEHTVGQRQFPDAEKYKEILVKLFHVPEDKVEERFHRDAEASRTFAPTYREAVCRMAAERGIAVAAHDDETLEHVEEAARLGMTISEFPTTLLAAEAARHRGRVTVKIGRASCRDRGVQYV